MSDLEVLKRAVVMLNGLNILQEEESDYSGNRIITYETRGECEHCGGCYDEYTISFDKDGNFLEVI